MAIVGTSPSRFFRKPVDLDGRIFMEAASGDSTIAFDGPLVLLWEHPYASGGRPRRGEANFRTRRHADRQVMISQLRVDSLADTSFYKDCVARAMDLFLRGNTHAAIPTGRIRSSDGCGASASAVENSRHLGARADALRSVNGSLRCVSRELTPAHPFGLC